MIISSEIIGKVTASLVEKLLISVGRRVKKEFLGDEKAQALVRVMQSGILAFMSHLRSIESGNMAEVESVLEHFFLNESVVQEVSAVLRGEELDKDSLLEIVEELGFDASTVPDLDWSRGLSDFEGAMLESAAGEAALQNTLLCNFAVKQLDALRAIAVQVGELIKLQNPNLKDRYLAFLVESNRYLRLVGLDIAELSVDGTDRALELMNVYITLETSDPKIWSEEELDAAVEAGFALVRLRQTFNYSLPHPGGFIQSLNLEHLERGAAEEWIRSSDTSRETVLRAIRSKSRTLLLGNAGSGKSTFVRHLAGCLAVRSLLERGRSDGASVNALEARVEEWLGDCPELDGLVPVLLQAQEFGGWLHAEAAQGASLSGKPANVWNFFAQRLRDQGLKGAENEIVQDAERGEVLLIVDGLDEVQEQHQVSTRKNIRAWLDRYPQSRVIVTCRKFSYHRSEVWSKLSLSTIEIGDFSYEQQVYFLSAWHAEFVRKKLAPLAEAEELFGQLIRSLKRPTIAEFAKTPLLLTLVTLIHTHKGRLPDAEVKLYDETVNLLLWGWERAKPSTSETRLHELLAEAARTESDLIRVLRQLAFEVHSGAARQISGDQARSLLAGLHPSKSLDWSQRVLDFLYYRSGLLVADGDGSWSFPHRRIQEYLASLHIAAESGSFVQRGIELAPDIAWHDVIVLATESLVHIFGNLYAPLALANELYAEIHPTEPANLNTLSLLARVFVSVGPQRANDTDLGKRLLGHIPVSLAQTVSSPRIAWRQKLTISEALDGIGDPRFNPDFFHLPNDAKLGLVKIPSGPFKMGVPGDQYLVEHDVESQGEFFISRYPVTTSQFSVFVNDQDHPPRSLECVVGPGNQPVTSVSWEEAVVYCTWLEAKLREDERTPPQVRKLLLSGWHFRLPTEAEWERAARGKGGRLHPWGDDFEPSRAVYVRRKLNEKGTVGWVCRRAPVGCVPTGATPEGVEDLSGNVWEWTHTRTGTTRAHSEFPYHPYRRDDGREDVLSHPSAYRVLKGGSAKSLAERHSFFPTIPLPNFGFRLVLSPRQIKAGTGATHPDATEQDLEIIYIHAPSLEEVDEFL